MASLAPALNNCWPTYDVLRHFATSCDIRMQGKPSTGIRPERAEAARLLEAAGISPPRGAHGGGTGQRLSYRYPANGIPGARRRDPDRRRARPGENPRVDALRLEFAVIALRVWLVGLAAGDKRVLAEYVRWQVGSNWATSSSLARHQLGSFSELKREASDENTRVRQSGGDPLADALARAEVGRSELQTAREADAVQQPDPVPFADALRAVLAGPHGEAQPAKH